MRNAQIAERVVVSQRTVDQHVSAVLRKPFSQSQRAVTKSGSTGRRGRSKMPF